jgi:hypothetical protein
MVKCLTLFHFLNLTLQLLTIVNEGKTAASFWCQVAAWVTDMFWNFYFVKKYKIAKNSKTTKAREKISTDLESLEFKKKFDICLTESKTNLYLWFTDTLIENRLINGTCQLSCCKY